MRDQLVQHKITKDVYPASEAIQIFWREHGTQNGWQEEYRMLGVLVELKLEEMA